MDGSDGRMVERLWPFLCPHFLLMLLLHNDFHTHADKNAQLDKSDKLIWAHTTYNISGKTDMRK